MSENEISRIIVRAATKVRRDLGDANPLESVHEKPLAFEPELADLIGERQQQVPSHFKGHHLAHR